MEEKTYTEAELEYFIEAYKRMIESSQMSLEYWIKAKVETEEKLKVLKQKNAKK